MKKSKALIVAVAACVTLLIGGGVAWAAGAFTPGTSAANTTEPSAYGACVSNKNGSVRVLERSNLAKSRYGACKQDGSEKFVLLSSGTTVKVPSLAEQWATAQKTDAKATDSQETKAFHKWLDSQVPGSFVINAPTGASGAVEPFLCKGDKAVTVKVGTKNVKYPAYACAKAEKATS